MGSGVGVAERGTRGPRDTRRAGWGQHVLDMVLDRAFRVLGRGLRAGHAESLFLCAQGSYNFQGNLRIPNLLELQCTWVLEEVNQRSGPW